MKQTIGKFLATLRKATGLTQEDVAEKIGISGKTLSSWETDRTTPDALTLPAIADLYGVTVDEILRGERVKNSEQPQISEKAKLSLIKQKYGKFLVKHFMFTAFGLLAIMLNVIGFVFLVYTAISEWVGILLSVIGFCGVITLTILLFFFERIALLSEGIIEGGDINENCEAQIGQKSSSLALCVKHKNAFSLKLFSLPFWAFSIATLSYLVAKGGEYTLTLLDTELVIDRTPIFVGFICASAVVGLIYLVAGICIEIVALKNYGNETQLVAYKKNKRLLRVLSPICSSIIVVSLVLAIVFNFVTIDVLNTMWNDNVEATKVHTKDFEKFKELSQTLILDDETINEFGLSSNVYFLQLPQDWHDGQEEWLTDLGHGFYGTLSTHDDANGHRPYEIMYRCEEIWDDEPDTVQEVYYTVAQGTIVKVYHDRAHTSYDYVLYLPITIYEEFLYRNDEGEITNLYDTPFLISYTCGHFVGKKFSTDEYGLFYAKHYHVEKFTWFCFVVITCVAPVVHALIYYLKREKLSYKI